MQAVADQHGNHTQLKPISTVDMLTRSRKQHVN